MERSIARSVVILHLFAAVWLAVQGWLRPAEAGCDLLPGETGRVVRVVDGETLVLDSGLTVRLIGALAPQRPGRVAGSAPWPPADRARAALAAQADGRTVRLFYGGPRRDRHGRALAHAFATGADGRVWLQGAQIDGGWARAYSFADQQACLDDLLEREARARAARKGLWAGEGFAVADALDVETLFFSEHAFMVVEGRVHAVGQGRGRTYLNFEADWRRDFTVSVGARNRASFARAGMDLDGLAGRRIWVRGWITRRNGPMIEADHTGQIEVLE